jgi:methyl-accepting chemotaxis protein
VNFFSSLSLRGKLSLGFGMVVFLLLSLAAFSVVQVSSIGEALRAQKNVADAKLAPLYVAREALDQTGIAARNAYIFKTEADAQSELAILDAQKALYMEQLAKLDNEFRGDELFAKVRTDMNAMAEALERPRKFREAGQLEQYGHFLVEECLPLRRRIVANIATLVASVENQNNAASELALAHEESAIFWIGIASLVSLLASVAVVVAISRSLFRQLGGDPAGAVTTALNIARGDLQSDIRAEGVPQNSLLAAMKTMFDNLHNIVSNVRAGSENISVASAEIASGNLDLSSRTEAQAAALEKVSTSMKELLVSVRQNASDADSASNIAANATAVSEAGGQVVAKVVKTMAEISESSRNIAEIVGVIDSIAFQTNILALNAAVEAARAGEQGRGFAVVASEVRQLAQRSATAAKEVKALISDSLAKVGDGTVLVEQAGSTMQSVVSEIQRVSGLMTDISTAAQTQNKSIERIDNAIGQLDDMTQQNAALVEEAAAAAQALEQQAVELTSVVQVFKLRHHG